MTYCELKGIIVWTTTQGEETILLEEFDVWSQANTDEPPML